MVHISDHTEKIRCLPYQGNFGEDCYGIRNPFSGFQITVLVLIFMTFYVVCLILLGLHIFMFNEKFNL